MMSLVASIPTEKRISSSEIPSFLRSSARRPSHQCLNTSETWSNDRQLRSAHEQFRSFNTTAKLETHHPTVSVKESLRSRMVWMTLKPWIVHLRYPRVLF